MLKCPPPPPIAPLEVTGPRPFWSVMIPTYNRTAYLERTLRSVLSQDPGPAEMQIEVVDNASTVDDPEPLVRRVGGERVNFFRHPRHVGEANWNSCIERSRGEWVHILHSDDIVYPGFYEQLKKALSHREDVGAAFCRYALIDAHDRLQFVSDLESPTPGILPDFIERIGVADIIFCPSIVVRRRVYEHLGAFRLDLSCADWEMWIRIAAHYPIWYEPSTLAAWRNYATSGTINRIVAGHTATDLRRCIALTHSLLPPDRAEAISRRARERAAIIALDCALACLPRLAFTGAVKHLWHGLRCSHSPRVMKALLLLPIRIARGGARRAYAAASRLLARE